MNILISSYPFHPSIGGIETVTELLAGEFVAQGHSVKVVTMTPSSAIDPFPYEVVRRPSPRQLINLVRGCDVYLQQNLSLRLAWPLLLVRRPWVVAMQTYLGDEGNRVSWGRRLKSAALQLTTRLTACSRALADQIGGDISVIPNPYRESVFRRYNDASREYDLVFLGRLVSDKGVSILFEALRRLRDGGLAPTLLIIGSGPEEWRLRSQCAALGLANQVGFCGALRENELSKRLNVCRIMVIPSIWDEPFGIVALEGIACGCAIVASNAGGLPEAVGPCGVTFPKGDAAALADRLVELLGDPRSLAAMRARAAEHLLRHRPATVAGAYLEILGRAVDPRGRKSLRSQRRQ
ncbi:MAG TPA: glycosyltransferase family 4 protein [Stellaceae bacterium]|nr:glycosyltransferase family 4 protein [Stellaceae bacterium]